MNTQTTQEQMQYTDDHANQPAGVCCDHCAYSEACGGTLFCTLGQFAVQADSSCSRYTPSVHDRCAGGVAGHPLDPAILSALAPVLANWQGRCSIGISRNRIVITGLPVGQAGAH